MNPFFSFALALAGPLVLKDVGQGAATEVFAAVSPKAEGISGKYLADCNVTEPRRDANDRVLATKLWDVSEKIVAALP
jgi:WW domain-containing oxidoreductase